jgi:ABC-2 type transport system ATP-binding protein
MDEAQRLADRVAIIAGGRIVAEGPPDELGDSERRPAQVSFELPPRVEPGELPAQADGVHAVGRVVTLTTDDPVGLLHALTGWALDRGVPLESLEVRRPSLEDIYLELTGEAEVETVQVAEVVTR